MTTQFSRSGIAQQLDPSSITQTEFVTAIVHLHRGELSEATAWRTRIDTTTNWAVVLSATSLSFVFADKSSERHILIPIISVFCTFLLLMEARRYRFYDIWRSRARMIEINFFRPMLDGSTAMPDWAARLAHDLEWPHFHMPLWEAAGRRLRRTYQWIFTILLGELGDCADDASHRHHFGSGGYRTRLGRGVARPLDRRGHGHSLWVAGSVGCLQFVDQPCQEELARRLSRTYERISFRRCLVAR